MELQYVLLNRLKSLRSQDRKARWIVVVFYSSASNTSALILLTTNYDNYVLTIFLSDYFRLLNFKHIKKYDRNTIKISGKKYIIPRAGLIKSR